MKTFIGFSEALELTLANVSAGDMERLPLLSAVGRTLAEDVEATVDSPSVSTSRKDGYAVIPEDLKNASPDSPVLLKNSRQPQRRRYAAGEPSMRASRSA